MTQVAILWHMHQPFYEDLVTREHILPWVRLHGLKDYFGMVALLREFPEVRVTFNLVPSLLVQLEAFAAGRARDRYLALGLKPAADLAEADSAFIVEHFFHAQRERMIDVYPRYAELLALRGPARPGPGEARAAVHRFTAEDLRDLQVWQKLAWIDPAYHESDARVRALVAKGRQFGEEDKATLRAIELELLNRVIPEYRAAAERGQIEIAASPFYHPILPLLCDTDVYLRTHPHARMPRQRFAHPEDAAEQLERAAACHERLFGRRPAGLWPSEGAVSDAMVPLVAAAGFEWMATDELVLARTLNCAFVRDGGGLLETPERLYVPYRVSVGGGEVACAFRDHVLSDLIGFTYAGWPAEAAADDFVGRLVAAGRRHAERTGGGEAFIPVILDGENAWEHFEGGGRPFLRALYGRLSGHPELKTVTFAAACRRPAAPVLTGLFPGSWIDANFSIWIGHADDRQAWGQVAEARAAVERARDADPAVRARAREEVLVAEGSDWFWWYGDDHSSAHDEEFDQLFRRHLRNVYRLLDRPIPDELFVSNITTRPGAAAQIDPTALLAPTLDGEETSYLEWLGAGLLEACGAAGAMHPSERPPTLVTEVRFGFGRDRLFVRVDGARPIVDLLAEGYELSLKFLEPDGVRFSVQQRDGRAAGTFWDRGAGRPAWAERGAGEAAFAAGRILELSLPLKALARRAGGRVAFFVAVYSGGGEVERHPESRPIEAVVPAADFGGRHWTA